MYCQCPHLEVGSTSTWYKWYSCTRPAFSLCVWVPPTRFLQTQLVAGEVQSCVAGHTQVCQRCRPPGTTPAANPQRSTKSAAPQWSLHSVGCSAHPKLRKYEELAPSQNTDGADTIMVNDLRKQFFIRSAALCEWRCSLFAAYRCGEGGFVGLALSAAARGLARYRS